MDSGDKIYNACVKIGIRISAPDIATANSELVRLFGQVVVNEEVRGRLAEQGLTVMNMHATTFPLPPDLPKMRPTP